MQHGTGRELLVDIVENVQAVLVRSMGFTDLQAALRNALRVLESDNDLDERGVYGPDYAAKGGEDTPERVVKYLGPTGSIRDTRPDTLGR